jgi:Trypsin-like peptidase domain
MAVMVRRGLAIALAAAAVGCAAPPAPPGTVESAVIYGMDGRRDLYEVDDPELRALATDTSVALIDSTQLTLDDEGRIQVEGRTLREAQELCADQRFGEQPVLAFCSGVLVDDDLLLTAGHCFESKESPEQACLATSFVFDFAYRAPDELFELGASHVFGCRKLVAFASPSADRDAPDYAVVQLDRPAERPPARTAGRVAAGGSAAPAVGVGLHLIGNGAGLPTKVDSGGSVTAAPDGSYLIADTDSFEGGSGSGVFDASLLLMAIQVRGLYDWQRSAGCSRAAKADLGGEQHLLVKGPLDMLCAAGYPSQRLCRRSARCGDGVCNAGENLESCEADCGTPFSQDGLSARGGCSVALGRSNARAPWQVVGALLIGWWLRSRRARSLSAA